MMLDNFRTVLAAELDPTIPGYRKRRVYPKSKAGCMSCKAGKVKVSLQLITVKAGLTLSIVSATRVSLSV